MYESFLCGAVSIEQLVQDAQQKVRWAAEPIKPGESIGAQIRKASNELRLDYGLVRRVWYGLGVGPVTYPTIYNAWCALVEKRAHTAQVLSFPREPLERITPRHLRRHASYLRSKTG